MPLRRSAPSYALAACLLYGNPARADSAPAPRGGEAVRARGGHARRGHDGAAPDDVRRPPGPLDDLAADLVEAFTGPRLAFYAGAVAATGVMAFGGTDQTVRVAVQTHLMAPAYADVAVYAGYVAPALIAPGVYLFGLVAHDDEAAGAGSAAVQALAVTVVTTAVLKVATGREFPTHGGDPNAPDRLDHPEYARDFRPFQTLWPLPAWPSGHTSATVSVAAALTGYYDDVPWVPLVGYPAALAIGAGLVAGDRHWASDFVAGALIGHAVGYGIGRAFRRRSRGEPAADAAPTLMPAVGPGWAGVALGADW